MADTLNARCTGIGCGHVWVAGPWPPTPAEIAQLLQTLRCPKCVHHAPRPRWTIMPEITRQMKREAALREVKMRRRAYPRWVADGRMTQLVADREIAVMEAKNGRA